MLQEAYERACPKLGIKISANEDDNTPTRTMRFRQVHAIETFLGLYIKCRKARHSLKLTMALNKV